MAKTIAEINEKIKKGKAVVVDAEEMIDIVKERGVEKAAQRCAGSRSRRQGADPGRHVHRHPPERILGGFVRTATTQQNNPRGASS